MLFFPSSPLWAGAVLGPRRLMYCFVSCFFRFLFMFVFFSCHLSFSFSCSVSFFSFSVFSFLFSCFSSCVNFSFLMSFSLSKFHYCCYFHVFFSFHFLCSLEKGEGSGSTRDACTTQSGALRCPYFRRRCCLFGHTSERGVSVVVGSEALQVMWHQGIMNTPVVQKQVVCQESPEAQVCERILPTAHKRRVP